jgi:hypothetical protein
MDYFLNRNWFGSAQEDMKVTVLLHHTISSKLMYPCPNILQVSCRQGSWTRHTLRMPQKMKKFTTIWGILKAAPNSLHPIQWLISESEHLCHIRYHISLPYHEQYVSSSLSHQCQVSSADLGAKLNYNTCAYCYAPEVLTSTPIKWLREERHMDVKEGPLPPCCTHDTMTLNTHEADSQSSALKIQAASSSRPHGAKSQSTTTLTFTMKTANLRYSWFNTWQTKLGMQQCPVPLTASSCYTSIRLAPRLPVMNKLITVKHN